MASRGDLRGKQMTTQTKSLYDRLGGLDAINAANGIMGGPCRGR